MQVGMMVLLLGKVADAAEEVKGGREVLDAPFTADALAVAAASPLRHRGEIGRQQLLSQGADTALARPAAAMRQVGRGGQGALLPGATISVPARSASDGSVPPVAGAPGWLRAFREIL